MNAGRIGFHTALITTGTSGIAEPELFPPQQLFSMPPESINAEDFELPNDRPEKILVINCGSSSLKYCFYDTAEKSRHARGLIDRIGALAQDQFASAFQAMIAELTARSTSVIDRVEDATVVAHRVVHGGEQFTDAVVIDNTVLEQIETLNPLAPLHNPVNVAGIREMRRLVPAARHIAVFDSAFHHTLPACAYLYGLPYGYYEQKRVRRYGFHGTSHHYASLRAAQFLRRRPDELRLISCHLGNGSSLCAVDRGRSVDTTMGFTPAEGLIMGTRCGDVDAGVLTFLGRTEGMTAAQCDDLLNQKSGLLGLSGISSDMREILKAANQGHPRAVLALDAYCYRVRKYLGAYVAALGGLDALVFTGGIGEGSAEIRARVLQGLDCLGIALDEGRNRGAQAGAAGRISTDHSKVAVLVVKADEEHMIAREALDALNDFDRKREQGFSPATSRSTIKPK
jgi:acetate kinase